MKKIIFFTVGAFLLGSLSSPFLGMAITPTRELLLGMAPEEAILILADKIDEQRRQDAEQEQNISQLQEEDTKQAQQIEELTQTDEIQKRQDCELKIKAAQDNLADIQRDLTSDQEVLRVAEADQCNDCYTKCLKNNGCDKSSCESDNAEENLDEIKKSCKEKHEENLSNRRKDVANDLERVKQAEAKLQQTQQECNQYL